MNDKQMFSDVSFFTICNSASSLGRFFNDVVTVSKIKTELLKGNHLNSEKDWLFSKIVFNDEKIGKVFIFIGEEDAMKLAKYSVEKKLHKSASTGWDELNVNSIEEIINILSGNMTEILNVIFGENIEIEAPELEFKRNPDQYLTEDEEYVYNTFALRFGDETIFIKEIATKEYYEKLIRSLRMKI